MRIALVVHDYDLRFGHGRYTVELARRLAPAHEVHVWANTFQGPPGPNLFFHRVPCWRRTALTSVVTFLGSEFLLRRHRYDLIHAQGMTCWHADVITAHMCNAARVQRLPPRRWRQRLFPWIVIPLERAFHQRSGARRLIAVSRSVGEDIRKYYHWQGPCTVVYHGTDTHTFRPPRDEAERATLRERFALPRDKWIWLFVGEGLKGLAEVIPQLAAFPTAHLLAVSRSNMDGYRRLARTAGVLDRVTFQAPLDDVAAAYQAADAFVYPSRYDPFGLVVSEAMAAGLPVVVGRQIGAAEWIEPGGNGLLCEPTDADSIRKQLEALARDPAGARQLGLAARRTVERYSWDTCAAQTLALYEEVLAEKSSSPSAP